MASGAASYRDCVSSLRSSLKFLESSVETLDNGVSDYPRLINVLKSVRVRICLLLPCLPRDIIFPSPPTADNYPNNSIMN